MTKSSIQIPNALRVKLRLGHMMSSREGALDKVHQVFVSSTFDDLKDERQQVTNALAKAGHIAAGMELFPATDQQQLQYIQRVIDRSDYYVVIVGGRYGSEASNGFSFTENECDYARSKGLPILAFLPADPANITAGKTDSDPSKIAKLNAFKSKLKTGRIVEFWNNSTDLCMKVVIAVGQSINLFPTIGWIRGDQAIDPKVLQEAERLRIENSELRERIANMESEEVRFDPRYAGPEHQVNFLIKASKRGDYGTPTERNVTTTLGRTFLDAYDALLESPFEYEIPNAIASSIGHRTGLDPRSYSFYADDHNLMTLRNQFEALGLIETFSMETKQGNYKLAWRVTSKGKRFALPLLALPPIDSEDVT
ncbi:MAG: DUF4062 domain-containing protein [Pseudomonadota bacterium]